LIADKFVELGRVDEDVVLAEEPVADARGRDRGSSASNSSSACIYAALPRKVFPGQ
jgi:hypothetical protein